MKQALLVIDVQNDYFKNGKMELVGPDQALDKIKQLEQYFNEKDLPIIYVQHINRHKPASFKKILKVCYFIQNSVLAVIH